MISSDHMQPLDLLTMYNLLVLDFEAWRQTERLSPRLPHHVELQTQIH